jgi:WD40 repeat protein
VRLWDTTTGELRHKLEESFAQVYSVAWSPDGRTLASGGIDDTVRLWDAGTGQLKITLEGHINYVQSVAFSFDSYLLASKSADGSVRLWRCETGECIAVLKETTYQDVLSSIAFHPKAPVLATLGEIDTVIRIWDLDFDVLLHAPSVARSVGYTNAKVVLVGETGLGRLVKRTCWVVASSLKTRAG